MTTLSPAMPTKRRFARRRRDLTVAVLVLSLTGVMTTATASGWAAGGPGANAVPASVEATAGTTSPTPESPPPDAGPTPGETLPPPEGSHFAEPVGGARLGIVGIPQAAESVPAPPTVDAQAWIVADVESGEVLGALNAHQPRPPASTIKLLTALAAVPEVDDDEYEATDADAAIEGSRVGLAPGETYSVDDILHGLMLASGNDAAHALGELAGGQDAVVTLMNDLAARLGAFDTHAMTPHGLDNPEQLSSAYDLALIGRQVLDDDQLAELVGTREYTFPGLDGQDFQIQNQNRLLETYDGAIGLKTGYTTNGAHTLVAAAERDGRTLIAVVLGSEDRGEDAAAPLLDWGFAAPDAEAIGTLVTPDDVAEAAEEADAGGGPLDRYQDVLNGDEGTTGDVPAIAWLSLAAAVVAGAVGLAIRRRPKQGGSGRYSSSSRR